MFVSQLCLCYKDKKNICNNNIKKEFFYYYGANFLPTLFPKVYGSFLFPKSKVSYWVGQGTGFALADAFHCLVRWGGSPSWSVFLQKTPTMTDFRKGGG